MEYVICQACHASIEVINKHCPQCGGRIKKELSEGIVFAGLIIVGLITVIIIL